MTELLLKFEAKLAVSSPKLQCVLTNAPHRLTSKKSCFLTFCVTAKELLSKTFIITQRGGNFSCYLSNFMTKWYYFWWNWIKRIYNCLQSSWSMKLNFGWNFATLLTWRPPDQTWTWHLLHRNVNISKHALSKHHKNSQIVEFSLCQNLWWHQYKPSLEM